MTTRLPSLLLVVVVALAACNSGGSDGGSGSGGQAAPGPSASPSGPKQPQIELPDLSGATVEVAGVWTGGEQDSFEKVADAFEEATGATVRYTPTGDNIGAIIGTRLQGGTPPDVAFFPQPGLLIDFAKQGALVPLDDETSALVEQNYAQIWRELGTIEDELYGVYFKAANKSPVWYDTEKFDQAGVSPTESWEQFLASAQRLADFGYEPVAVAGGDGWTLTDWFENVYLRVAGPDLYDQLAAHEIPWTHDSVIEALRTLGELWQQDQLLASDPLLTGYPDSVTKVFGTDGQAAIVYEADFTAGVITGSTEAKIGEDADYFVFPDIGDPVGPLPIIAAGNAAAMLRDNEATRAFMRFVATPAAAESWAGAGGFLSPNKAVDPSVYPDEATRELAKMIVEGDPVRFDLSDLQPAAFGSTVAQGLYKYLQDFLSGDDPRTVAESLEEAASQAYQATYGQDTNPIGTGDGDEQGNDA